ncbi:MAG TPA: hypothetical protein VKU36_03560 [Candidatus Babeliales bacterium]|nr:hypothetical protein [Candidatus Babeliales bacterium]
MTHKNIFFLTLLCITATYYSHAMKRHQGENDHWCYPYPNLHTATDIKQYSQDFKEALEANITYMHHQNLLSIKDITNYKESQMAIFEKNKIIIKSQK